MNSTYTLIIGYIKDIGAVLGIVAAIVAIIANWRTLFAPYQKKLKDDEFDTVTQLVEKLADPHFLIFYTEPLSEKTIEIAKSAALPYFFSPFLPEELRQSVWGYLKSVFTIKDESQKALLWDQHQELYRRATRLLGAKGAKLPDFRIFLNSLPKEPSRLD